MVSLRKSIQLTLVFSNLLFALTFSACPAPDCDTDGDCGAESICLSGVCEAAVADPNAPAPCTIDDDCSGDAVCFAGVCGAPPTGSGGTEPRDAGADPLLEEDAGLAEPDAGSVDGVSTPDAGGPDAMDPPDAGAPETDPPDAGPGTPEPTVPAVWTCDPSWYGADGYCDCGCGALDAECSGPSADACDFSNCASGHEPSTANNAQCVASSPASPGGSVQYTSGNCSYWDIGDYENDYTCDCGCGEYDYTGCYGSGANKCDADHCPSGSVIDPDDNSRCIVQ